MTIWTFGDSFTRHFRELKHFENLSDTWVEKTRKLLNHDIVSFSKPLSCIEETFLDFDNIRSKLSSNDIVIMSVTNLERRWFSKNNPLRIINLNKKEKTAINKYIEHLHFQFDLQEIYLVNFLHNLNDITKRLNLHTIVIPSFLNEFNVLENIKDDFNEINFPNAPMARISVYELKSNAKMIDFGSDLRTNHMSRDNHIIMTDKIIDNIKNKTPLDFTNGFKENFLDEDLLNDPIFIKDQLFSGITKKLQRIKNK